MTGFLLPLDANMLAKSTAWATKRKGSLNIKSIAKECFYFLTVFHSGHSVAVIDRTVQGGGEVDIKGDLVATLIILKIIKRLKWSDHPEDKDRLNNDPVMHTLKVCQTFFVCLASITWLSLYAFLSRTSTKKKAAWVQILTGSWCRLYHSLCRHHCMWGIQQMEERHLPNSTR